MFFLRLGAKVIDAPQTHERRLNINCVVNADLSICHCSVLSEIRKCSQSGRSRELGRIPRSTHWRWIKINLR
jgi:hypothetical protein